MNLRIVMLGAPGAGKGTQAKRMAETLGVPHISTGDIFRAHLKGGTSLGKQVKQYLDAGKLVPDELTCDIVAQRLAESDCAAGYVLDGFPRTVAQAEMLDSWLLRRGDGLDLALNVDVPDAVITERLSARRTCPACGAIFNLKFGPSRRGDLCDRAGCNEVKLVQRSDDCEETIRERLRVYHDSTEPIIGYYDKQRKLKTIDAADLPPDDVFARIQSALAQTKRV